MSHIRTNQRHVLAVFSAVAICCGVFSDPQCFATELGPDTPLLTQWRQAVVERVQGYGERKKLADFSWPEDQRRPGVCVAGSRLNLPGFANCRDAELRAFARELRPRVICNWYSGRWLQFFEVFRDERTPLGAFRTCDVPFEDGASRRHCVVAGEDALYALFLDWHRPIIKHAYRFVPGQAPEEVPVQTIPNRESILFLDSGKSVKPAFDVTVYAGPLSVVDASGRVHSRGVLAPGWWLFGNPVATIKATKERFLVGVPALRISEIPPDFWNDPYVQYMVLMQLEYHKPHEQAVAPMLYITADEELFRLLPSFEPSSSELTDVAFLGDSIHGRIAVKKVTRHRSVKEQLYCIELWAYRDGRAAVLIDLIAWYNGPKQRFHYWTGSCGGIHEMPMAHRMRGWNIHWQLVPVASGPDKVVYAREDGIWQVKLP